jgi:hypothetical protein
VSCIKDDINPRDGIRYTRIGCRCPVCRQFIEDWTADWEASRGEEPYEYEQHGGAW